MTDSFEFVRIRPEPEQLAEVATAMKNGCSSVMRLRAAFICVLIACTPRSNEPLVLTYYHLQFCTFCQGVKAAVEEMPAMYPGRLSVRTVEHLEPEGREAVKRYSFKSHGLVITRGEEVVFRQPDHRVELEQVRLALERLLGQPTITQARRETAPLHAE